MTTAFAGIVTFDDGPGASRFEPQICGALTRLVRRRVDVARSEGALFAQLIEPAKGNGRGGPSRIERREGGRLFAVDARLDNRAELAEALGLSPPELARTSDGALLTSMYERWGEAGLVRCLGAFAFAAWDPSARRLVLARDYLAARPIFFHRGPGFVAFGSIIGTLLALPFVPRALDEVLLASFLAVNYVERRRTLYRGIERVPSRTAVTLERDATSHREYWIPDLHAPPPYRREEDYVERARELLDQAVAAAIADTPHVAIATSGGLDSSAVAATAARLDLAERVTCYTLVPPPGTDIDVGPGGYLSERPKVEALARMHPGLELRLCEEGTLHPFEEDESRFFARSAMPVHGPVNTGPFNQLFGVVGEAGHTALLLGTSGNFGLTWRGSHALLTLLRSGRIGAFARELSAAARTTKRGAIGAVATHLVWPVAPLPLRRLLYRLRGVDPDAPSQFTPLNPDFVAAAELPRRWRAEGFDPHSSFRSASPVADRAYYLFDHNSAGRDVRGMRNQWLGFEVRDPLGDRRLLEFVLAVPETLYFRNGVPRAFARAVLADRLPREILHERRRGAQGVTWFRRMSAGRAAITADLDRMEASPLARSVVDLPRLRRLVSDWPADEQAAEKQMFEYRVLLSRGLHVGRFICWVEGGNA